MGESRGSAFRFSLAGFILVALGVLLLLQSLDVVSWNVWRVIVRFWPVILVLIGLNLILGRLSPWVSAILGIVLIGGVIVAAVALEPGSDRTPVAFSQSLDGVQRAEVEIDFGAGELKVRGLPSNSTNLAEGSAIPSVSKDFEVRNGVGELRLEMSGITGPFFAGDDKLKLEALLNRNVLLELVVKTGASSAEIDLSELRVTRFRLDMGASSVDLRLPQGAGTTDVEVKAGAASVRISVPRGVAAQITSNSGLTSLDVDTARFPRSGSVFQSPDYGSAANKVNIKIDAGVSSIKIQ